MGWVLLRSRFCSVSAYPSVCCFTSSRTSLSHLRLCSHLCYSAVVAIHTWTVKSHFLQHATRCPFLPPCHWIQIDGHAFIKISLNSSKFSHSLVPIHLAYYWLIMYLNICFLTFLFNFKMCKTSIVALKISALFLRYCMFKIHFPLMIMPLWHYLPLPAACNWAWCLVWKLISKCSKWRIFFKSV